MGARHPQRLAILHLEDNRLDADLTQSYMAGVGFNCVYDVVDTESAFRARLAAKRYHIILADFSLPEFSGAEALAIARALAPDTPFVMVSGVLGEEHAVEMLKQGATDYVIKQRLARLPMVVNRALSEAGERLQRQRAERALRESETSYRLLVDTLKDYAVIGLDPKGCIVSWNMAAEQILGHSPDHVVGQPVSHLYRSAAEGTRIVRECLDSATRLGSHTHELWMKRADGADFHASVVTSAIREPGGELFGFSKIIRDTTAARRAADTLRRAKEDAEAANTAKDRFLAVLSHELRTPLTPIMTATDLLERSGVLPAEVEAVPAMIRRNVELEARLIDDLLDMTAIRHNKMSLAMAVIDFAETLREVLQGLEADLRERAIELSVHIHAPRSQVYGDPVRLHQIISNLVRNAIKFTPAGGRVVVELTEAGCSQVRLRVIDTGIGINAEALPRIFTPFEQADSRITRQYGGLGLGLAIAHGLAAKHGGSLHAESPGVDRGATFTLSLPLLEARACEAPAEAPAAPPPSAAPLKILLVEDNEDTRLAMSELLRLAGHSVDTAMTAASALAKIQCDQFDLLISDLALPDGDGRQIASVFSRDQRKPAIAMSGYGMDRDIRESQQAGFMAHLTKPVNFDRLGAVIEQLSRGQGRAG